MWNDDDELFAAIRNRLFPAVLGDVLDSLGYFQQFLPPAVQPLRDDMVVLGRAMPCWRRTSLTTRLACLARNRDGHLDSCWKLSTACNGTRCMSALALLLG